jgi:hypothetical protein
MAQRTKTRVEDLKAKQADWERRIAAWQRSGLSQRLFCERRGMALSTFQWWRKRLADGQDGQPSFLPLALSAARGAVEAVVHIELKSGTRLRLEGEAALRAVAALVRRVS